jgi:hypothetical protein
VADFDCGTHCQCDREFRLVLLYSQFSPSPKWSSCVARLRKRRSDLLTGLGTDVESFFRKKTKQGHFQSQSRLCFRSCLELSFAPSLSNVDTTTTICICNFSTCTLTTFGPDTNHTTNRARRNCYRQRQRANLFSSPDARKTRLSNDHHKPRKQRHLERNERRR